MKFIVELSSLVLVVAFASSLVAADLIGAINGFAKELYKTTINDHSGNVIISPISVQTASTLLLLGATGSTEAELKTGLQFEGLSKKEIANNFQNLTRETDSSRNFELANKIYLSDEYNLKSTYEEVLEKKFNSKVEKIDFNDSVNAARSINNWMDEKTHGKIGKIINSSDLKENTKMVLLNAVHFKGDWVKQFDIAETCHDAKFYINENETVKIELMKMIRQEVKYSEFDEFRAIELPYKHSDLSLLILLPYRISGLPELEKRLSELDFNNISANLQVHEFDVFLPKFKIEFETNLNDPLEKMGVKRMFGNLAEFNELIDSKDKLKVSNVIHKAVIDVNEVGTEASAFTEVQLELLSFIPPFHANHPFMFILKTKNYPVFIGRYVEP